MVIEHYAPLSEPAREFYGLSCARLAEQAGQLGLSEEWRRFLDPAGPDHPLDAPDGYISEGNVLAVGTVPGAAVDRFR